jgi:hypothetical protein
MKILLIVFSLFLNCQLFSQNVIEILENTLTNSLEHSHSEMKSLGLTLDAVNDIDELIVFAYSTGDMTNIIRGGALILKNDFKTVVAFTLSSINKSFTELAMKELQSEDYIYKMVKDGGEIVYSNGLFDIGFLTEFSSTGNTYQVSISRIKI